MMDRKQKEEEIIRAYLELISNDTISLIRKVNTTRPATNEAIWSATFAVLNSLLNTGGINNIKNDSLKFLLTNWSVNVVQYSNLEEMYKDRMQALRTYENARIPRRVVKAGNYDFWPGVYLPNNLESKYRSLKVFLVDDMQYQNFLADITNTLYIQFTLATNIKEDYQKISELIVAELKERKIDMADNN